MEVGDYYPVCNCGGHDSLKFIGFVEEHATSRMPAGPWIANGRTLNVYAAFTTERGGIMLTEPKICGNIIAFNPVGGGDTLASCSKRLTYRLKKD